MADKEGKTKVTMAIPEHIRREAKAKAALEKRPFSEVVTELLQEWLRSDKGKEG